MMRKRFDPGWRVAALAAALFAITLNFLQPLAHAALMREGGPQAAALMWDAFCQPAADQDDERGPPPAAGTMPECCLGLAHAPVLPALALSFLLVEPTAITTRFAAALDTIPPVGMRDGPAQPRAPPPFI